MGLIEIENMEFYAYHGHFAAEQVVGNKFLVYLALETNTHKASETDLLDDALNYQAAYMVVKKQMEIPSKLLEHIAGRILDALYIEFNQIAKATVKIQKMNPPMGGRIGSVSVTMTK